MANPRLLGHNAYDRAIARERAGLAPKWMVEAGDTEFERVVKDAGVEMVDAHRNSTVRQWIDKNYRMKYVPPVVLEAMGIRAEEVV